MDDITISVIVPIYKAEKYLRKCIDSIINQTYQNLEIILVDDGSPDTCPQICDEYGKRDTRIKVIHQKNGGVSCARNTGINEASSEYLTFIDSDDYIEHDMFELIASALMKQKVDLVFIREKSVNLRGETTHINGTKESGNTTLGNRDDAAKIIIGMQCNGMCDKTYRRSTINELRVEENKKHGEDLLFNLEYLTRVKTIAYVDKILYSYVSNDDSITHEAFNEHTLDAFYFKDKAADIIEREFPEYIELAKRRAFAARQSVLRLLWQEQNNKNEIVFNSVINYLENNYPNIKNSLSRKERIEYLLFKYIPSFYSYYLNIVNKLKKIKGE